MSKTPEPKLRPETIAKIRVLLDGDRDQCSALPKPTKMELRQAAARLKKPSNPPRRPKEKPAPQATAPKRVPQTKVKAARKPAKTKNGWEFEGSIPGVGSASYGPQGLNLEAGIPGVGSFRRKPDTTQNAFLENKVPQPWEWHSHWRHDDDKTWDRPAGFKGTNKSTGPTDPDRVVTFSENIGSINGTTGFGVRQYTLNPGIAETFPVLNVEAQLYTRYAFANLVFQFGTLTSSFANTGRSYMAVNLEANDAIPADIEALSNNSIMVSRPVHEDLRMEIAGVTRHVTDTKFVRGNLMRAGCTRATCDLGSLFVATYANTLTTPVGLLHAEGVCYLFDKLETTNTPAISMGSQTFKKLSANLTSGGSVDFDAALDDPATSVANPYLTISAQDNWIRAGSLFTCANPGMYKVDAQLSILSSVAATTTNDMVLATLNINGAANLGFAAYDSFITTPSNEKVVTVCVQACFYATLGCVVTLVPTYYPSAGTWSIMTNNTLITFSLLA